MNDQQQEEEMVNASFQHPFTCLVAGPSGSGKTTFVKELLLNKNSLIDIGDFSHITIYIGTRLDDNVIFQQLKQSLPETVSVVECKELYDGDVKEFESNFAQDFVQAARRQGPGGCVVFDDLMQELSRANLLTDLFSKHSSHLGLSVIHITQNLFFRGKQPQEHRTLYTNTHHLVLFKFPLDNTVFAVIAKRLGAGNYNQTLKMMEQVADKYRYVIINGGFSRSKRLRFTSDIFGSTPFFYQRQFALNDTK